MSEKSPQRTTHTTSGSASPVSNTPQTPPELPPKTAPALPPRAVKSELKPILTSDSRTASVLALRQSELYGSPGMNMYGDVVASTKVELDPRLVELGSEDLTWTKYIRDYSDEYIWQNRAGEVELAIVEGIPVEFRPLVYLKTMRVFSHIEENSYSSLVKKGKLAKWEDSSAADVPLPEELAEFLQVYEYFVREVASSQEADVATRKFVIASLPLVASLPDLSKPEIFAILVKLGALASRTSKDEYCYKCSRALETLENEAFVHIVKQGIDVVPLFKKILFELFSQQIEREVAQVVLDLIVFEGVDFLVRLTAALFHQNTTKIIETNQDELSQWLFGEKFLSSISIDTVRKATKLEIPLIKFENEFHLINANAISGNDNELINLKDANEDLLLNINNLKLKIENLKKTQTEILSQSDEYTKKLLEAQAEKQKLTESAQELQAKYAHLTMKENLTNTIQANRDISSGNADLEAQIAELEKKVAAKKAKLEKLAKP